MLLRLNDLIINTDQIIKAKYHANPRSSLFIHMADTGERATPTAIPSASLVMLYDADAQLMWSALSQIATPVVPKLPGQQ